MREEFEKILFDKKTSKLDKIELIKLLKDTYVAEANKALDYIDNYKYCPKCNDWYRTNSFETFSRTEAKEVRHCGAGEWDDDTVSTVEETYLITICPKGHEDKRKAIDVIL